MALNDNFSFSFLLFLSCVFRSLF